MKGKRFTEEQIIRILKEAEASGNTREVCRRHNVSEQSFYRWRRKYGGMDIDEAKRLKSLERENAELKRVVGEMSLDNRMLRDVLGNLWSAPVMQAPVADGKGQGCANLFGLAIGSIR